MCHGQLYTAVDPREDRKTHKVKILSEDEMLALAHSGNMSHFTYVLDNILLPRVVGTPTHSMVKEFIKTSMNDLGWRVTTDKFSSATPIFGTLEFENIIATLNPKAGRYLVLACHYDSKYFRENNFVGATDSAVPCAMMINIAHTMKKQLETSKNQDRLSIKLVFFDGEEAFRHWSPTDSIYGARHLAAKWERSRFPANNRDGTNVLHSIDLLVLLDLLGAPDPVFSSYFRNTYRWYRMLVDAESALVQLGALKRYSAGKPAQTYFQPVSSGGLVEDDHIPFLQRGVPILHVIPYPFPAVWHTPQDNKAAVDNSTVENLINILKLFTTSYMNLKV